MNERRPRIHPDQAAIIDALRGRVPFEVEVADIIGTYLDLFTMERFGDKPRPATDDEVLLNLLRSEFFMFEGERFRKAVDAAMTYWEEEMERQRLEDEAEAEVDGEFQITIACPECGSRLMKIPGAPRALPGQTLDSRQVAATCGECKHEGVLADFTHVGA